MHRRSPAVYSYIYTTYSYITNKKMVNENN